MRLKPKTPMDYHNAEQAETVLSDLEAKHGSLHRLVGRIGEFTDGDGIVRQCRVTGLADEGIPEFKGLITITYCRDGEKIEGAVIGACEFRADSPNSSSTK